MPCRNFQREDRGASQRVFPRSGSDAERTLQSGRSLGHRQSRISSLEMPSLSFAAPHAVSDRHSRVGDRAWHPARSRLVFRGMYSTKTSLRHHKRELSHHTSVSNLRRLKTQAMETKGKQEGNVAVSVLV